MTLLKIVELDEILTLNSTWENKFFEPWAKVSTALVWKLWENQNKKTIKKKPKKRKLLDTMIHNFLYSYIYNILTLLLSFLFFYCRKLSSGYSCDKQQHTIRIQKLVKLNNFRFLNIFNFFFFNIDFLINSKPKSCPLSIIAQKICFLTYNLLSKFYPNQ